MSDVKVLKLTTGEEIIARVKQKRDYMELEKPMTMACARSNARTDGFCNGSLDDGLKE